jgi:hypothetical protein
LAPNGDAVANGKTRVHEATGKPAPQLPHERDESAESGAARQPVIQQAAIDREAGLVDTDNYTRASAVVKRIWPRRRRLR